MGPVFCFGLIADVQHADKETVSFDGRLQRYRESKAKLHGALDDFSRCSQPAALQFVLTLGDIIDGYPGDPARTSADLQVIAQMFDSQLPVTPVHHVLGNHCLTASRGELLQALHMPGSYYSIPVSPGWRLIVLDTTEMSLHSGYPEVINYTSEFECYSWESYQMQEARQWLAAHPIDQHPNAEAWNGGCSSRQIRWLEEQLLQAAQSQQQVMVACHHPLAPGSAPAQYLAWGYDQLVKVLSEAPAGVVKCVFSGHYHPGGYALHRGVHYVVFAGILEAPADSTAYGIVEVWADRLVIGGRGVAASRELALK